MVSDPGLLTYLLTCSWLSYSRSCSSARLARCCGAFTQIVTRLAHELGRPRQRSTAKEAAATFVPSCWFTLWLVCISGMWHVAQHTLIPPLPSTVLLAHVHVRSLHLPLHPHPCPTGPTRCRLVFTASLALGGHLALRDGAPVSNGGGLGRTERVTRRALDVVVAEELALHAREAEPRAAHTRTSP